jgi:hypothetical protein
MPELSNLLKTFDAIDFHCGMSGTVTFGSKSYPCDKTVFIEKTFFRKIKGYLFSLIITGSMNPRPAIGDKVTWDNKTLIVKEIDEADTETRLHLGKSISDES